MQPTDGPLRPSELVVRGGHWGASLWNNAFLGLPPALSWDFTIEFAEVEREYGTSPVSLSCEYVELPDADWYAMTGRTAVCEEFGEPIETSAYFFEHHPYEAARVHVREQDGARLRVAIEARGDEDGLGLDPFAAEAWLDFRGLGVSLDGVATLDEARRLLDAVTDVAGLDGAPTPHGGFLFLPA